MDSAAPDWLYASRENFMAAAATGCGHEVRASAVLKSIFDVASTIYCYLKVSLPMRIPSRVRCVVASRSCISARTSRSHFMGRIRSKASNHYELMLDWKGYCVLLTLPRTSPRPRPML